MPETPRARIGSLTGSTWCWRPARRMHQPDPNATLTREQRLAQLSDDLRYYEALTLASILPVAPSVSNSISRLFPNLRLHSLRMRQIMALLVWLFVFNGIDKVYHFVGVGEVESRTWEQREEQYVATVSASLTSNADLRTDPTKLAVMQVMATRAVRSTIEELRQEEAEEQQKPSYFQRAQDQIKAWVARKARHESTETILCKRV